MAYYIDLNDITLDDYQSILQAADLLPSRRCCRKTRKKLSVF